MARTNQSKTVVALLRELINEVKALREDLRQKKPSKVVTPHDMFQHLKSKRLPPSTEEFIDSLYEDFKTRGLSYLQIQALERNYHRY